MDHAAFEATFAGFRSLADGDYRISFDFPGEKLEHVVAVLAQGGKPSAAKGTWFAIARLNIRGTGEDVATPQTTPGESALQNVTIGQAAPGASAPPARSLSQYLHKKLCIAPVGRAFLEEFCSDVRQGQKINSAEFAHHVLVRRLGIESLSEVDRDPIISAQAEELLRWFSGWERGLETPRIQQKNEA